MLSQTVTQHAQAVGAWSKTGGVINPAGAVAMIMAAGVAVDAGGTGAENFHADAYFSGGTISSVTDPIDTSALPDPAPQQVYQTERVGDFTYTIPHLLPDTSYIVRLDFAELDGNGPGQRLFNVMLNGDPVLTSFDIEANAGGKDRAISRNFVCDPDSTGQIAIGFTSILENATVCGIQVTPAPDLALGKEAVASSIESPQYAATMAVDGDSTTRWSSGQWTQATSTGWIEVDLAATYNVSEVRLNWQMAYAADYQIQVSTDALNWSAIETVEGNASGGIVDFAGLNAAGRYVRIYCTLTGSDSDNYSLYDLQVFGLPAAVTTQPPGGPQNNPPPVPPPVPPPAPPPVPPPASTPVPPPASAPAPAPAAPAPAAPITAAPALPVETSSPPYAHGRALHRLPRRGHHAVAWKPHPRPRPISRPHSHIVIRHHLPPLPPHREHPIQGSLGETAK